MPAPVRRKALVLVLAFGAVLAFASVAYADNGGFAPVPPESPGAQNISDTYYWIAGFTGAVFILVEGSLVWFILKYRRRGRDRTVEGPQVHGATRLELIWTVVPVLILAAIVAFVFVKLPGIRDVPSAKAQGGPLNVRIDAHQFYWQFSYPDGQVSINELHVPVNRVVKVDIHSRDVDHSWWVPALQGKFDAIPGETNETWFKAEKPGTYRGQCGEFCGVYHATMKARVIAQSQGDYEAFLQSTEDTQVLGRQEWQGVCASCHALDGTGGYGPNIQSNSLLVSADGLRTLLTSGLNQAAPVANYMPPVGKGWTDAQLKALMAYVKAHVYKAGTNGG
jgi:cytochrome c oxidase subunit II